jgi:hypothetical protein
VGCLQLTCLQTLLSHRVTASLLLTSVPAYDPCAHILLQTWRALRRPRTAPLAGWTAASLLLTFVLAYDPCAHFALQTWRALRRPRTAPLAGWTAASQRTSGPPSRTCSQSCRCGSWLLRTHAHALQRSCPLCCLADRLVSLASVTWLLSSCQWCAVSSQVSLGAAHVSSHAATCSRCTAVAVCHACLLPEWPFTQAPRPARRTYSFVIVPSRGMLCHVLVCAEWL